MVDILEGMRLKGRVYINHGSFERPKTAYNYILEHAGSISEMD